ncbi:MAG: PilZ domain-containing protein [Deltaproteobacteria bacterium]
MLNCDLNEMIKTDQTVKTQVSNNFNWIDNKIISISNDVIQLDFKEEYLKQLVTIGDSFKIRVSHKKKECILIGFVENVILGIENKMFVRIENVLYYDNAREHTRCNVNLFCKIEPLNEEFKIQGITTDISEGGISMVTYADFNIVEPVNVEIVANNNIVIEFKGKIKRLASKINNHIQYGIEIFEISDRNKDLLNKLILNSNK